MASRYHIRIVTYGKLSYVKYRYYMMNQKEKETSKANYVLLLCFVLRNGLQLLSNNRPGVLSFKNIRWSFIKCPFLVT